MTKPQLLAIKIKKLHPNAKLPKVMTAGAGCFDLFAMLENDEVQTLSPGKTVVIRTGLAFQIPADKVMLVYSRSGHGFKRDIRLANSVGVIDADYTGEVMVKLRADGHDTLHIAHGDSIAQALLVDRHAYVFEEVAELDATARGGNGFGHTSGL